MFTKVLVLMTLSTSAVWAQNRCEGLFFDRTTERYDLRDISLGEIRNREVEGKTAEDVVAMNVKTLAALEAEVPFPNSNSKQKSQISMATAKMLLQEIYKNPVVKPMSDKYDQPGTSIGYCFGRATFVHMMLLKLGVQKKSIQKIFAVGPMKAGGIMWQFHVATMTYVEGLGWMVIDSNHMNPLPVRDWMAHYYKQAADGKVRFYATDASKFTFELGKYSRVQLGLDMPAERDWYRHYFKDMFIWMRDKKVTEEGVVTITRPVSPQKTTEEEKSISKSIVDLWQSAIEFRL